MRRPLLKEMRRPHFITFISRNSIRLRRLPLLRGLVAIAASFLHQATPWLSGIVWGWRLRDRWFESYPFCQIQIQNASSKSSMCSKSNQIKSNSSICSKSDQIKSIRIRDLTSYCRHKIFKVHDKYNFSYKGSHNITRFREFESIIPWGTLLTIHILLHRGYISGGCKWIKKACTISLAGQKNETFRVVWQKTFNIARM